LFGEEAGLVPVPVHVDNTVFGAVPLEIYIQTKEQNGLVMGKAMADKQWEILPPESSATRPHHGWRTLR
jgi:hypothetical protein